MSRRQALYARLSQTRAQLEPSDCSCLDRRQPCPTGPCSPRAPRARGSPRRPSDRPRYAPGRACSSISRRRTRCSRGRGQGHPLRRVDRLAVGLVGVSVKPVAEAHGGCPLQIHGGCPLQIHGGCPLQIRTGTPSGKRLVVVGPNAGPRTSRGTVRDQRRPRPAPSSYLVIRRPAAAQRSAACP